MVNYLLNLWRRRRNNKEEPLRNLMEEMVVNLNNSVLIYHQAISKLHEMKERILEESVKDSELEIMGNYEEAIKALYRRNRAYAKQIINTIPNRLIPEFVYEIAEVSTTFILKVRPKGFQ